MIVAPGKGPRRFTESGLQGSGPPFFARKFGVLRLPPQGLIRSCADLRLLVIGRETWLSINEAQKLEHADSEKQPADAILPDFNQSQVPNRADVSCSEEGKYETADGDEGEPEPSATE